MTAPPQNPPGRAAALRAGLGRLVGPLDEVCRTTGHPELAEWLARECHRPSRGAARIVVAGASKRGKSALVNALLDRPGLVPVDSDVATGIHVAVRSGPDDRAVVHLVGGEPAEIPTGEIARYADERANPDNALGVLAIEAQVRSSRLPVGLELVDTPGMDSVIGRHGDVTRAALALADALVVVVDPERPLVDPELAFLASATQRIATVLFVMTKTDLHPEWRRTLDDDRSLLASHAPRFQDAPFLMVSSRLAEAAGRARDRGRATMADRLVAESGIDELTDRLADVVATVEVIRLGNVVQLCLAVISRLTMATRASVPAPDDGTAARQTEADVERLQRLTDRGSRWREELGHGVRRLQLDLDAALIAAAERAEKDLDASLTPWRAERGDTLARELDDLARAMWLQTATLVRDRVHELVVALVEVVAEHDVELAVPELILPVREHRTVASVDPELDPTATGLTGALSAYGATAGLAFGAERVLMMLGPAFGLAGLGIGAAVGLAGVVVRRKATARVREQSAARRLVARSLLEARSNVSREFSRHLLEVQHAVETAVVAALSARRQELDHAIAERRAAQKRSTADDQNRRREAVAHLDTLAALMRDAEGLQRLTVPS